jgi:ATP-dependent Zn protease
MVDIKKGSPWESVTLTTLSRDRHVFAELLNEARQMAIESQEGKTVIFTCWGLEWRQFGQPRRKRALSSVILDRGVKERIVSDVKDFLGSSRYYYERGSSFCILSMTIKAYHIAEDICFMVLREVERLASYKRWLGILTTTCVS